MAGLKDAIIRRLAASHIAGPRIADALAHCRHAAAQGWASTICPWTSGTTSPDDALALYLEAVEAIAREARAHLVPGGHLLIEHGYDQGERSVDCLRGLGYRDVIDHRDLAGLPRLVQGRFDPGEAGG